MKTRVLVACVVLLSLIAAQPGLPAGASLSPPEPGDEYLLSLPVPTPSPDVPANLTPEGAAAYARRLLLQQADPLLARLQTLRDERAVVDYEIRPDLYGVVVRLAKSAEPQILDRLPGVNAVEPVANDKSCAHGAVKALEQQLLGASQATALREHETRTAASAEATNPSISVYRDPDGSYGYVQGYTDASTPVSLIIYRSDGSVRTARATTSSSSGWYYFYPSWHSCPVNGYDWVPRVGDRVQVTAAGNTVSTTVVPLSLWADPAADTVYGATAAGRTVEVEVQYPGVSCSGYMTDRIVASDVGGAFTASFAGIADLTGSSRAYAYVLDGNGNSTYVSSSAYAVYTRFDDTYFGGYLKPNLPFSATLTRGVTPIDSVTGITGADNYFYGYFGEPIQAGDVIEVSGPGVTVSLTAATLTNLVLDPATDSVSGTTSPGRALKAWFVTESYYPSYNGCSGNYGYCVDTTADGAGYFTLHSSHDWAAGDYVYLYLYDAAGNYQYSDSMHAPLILPNAGRGYVDGTWPESNINVSATLSRVGSVIDTDTAWVSSGDYSLYFYPYPEPGDVIEVTDGVTTASMTVLDVTAHVNSLTDLVYGHSPAAPAIMRLYNYRASSGYWYSYCRELSLPGGNYSVDFGLDLGGADDASLYVRGSDGHKTRAYGHAFWLAAGIGARYAYGYTTEPSTDVQIDLLDDVGVVKGSANDESGTYDGFYDVFFSPIIVPGDSLEVTTGDGWNATVEVPELTAEQDEVNNQIYGQSPAGQPVRASLRRHYNSGWWSYTFGTQADAAGNYSVPLDGYYWSRDCSPLEAGGRCTSTEVSYYNSAGHEIYKEGDYPPPVGADAFEEDDAYTAASPYLEVQSHSFHDYPDYDWVQFSVPPEDVNSALYQFRIWNLGWGMATQARLYESDGTTLIWEATAYENQGDGLDYGWTPTSAGTYYLQIRPPDSFYSAYCDAVYDLRIFAVRERIFLPIVMRIY